MKSEVYFSLGSNLGNKKENLDLAIALMEKNFLTKAHTISNYIETEPVGFVSDSNFLNCAVRFDLSIDCLEILKICKEIEKNMGRDISNPVFDEDGNRIYKSRIIDIDILFYGFSLIDHSELKVPHSEMTKRDFVMIPLREIASDAIKSHFSNIFS